MKHLTVRNLPPDVALALAEERSRHGRSLNQTVIDLLRHALGVQPGQPYDNGLARHAGAWTEEELLAFEEATAVFEQVDEELWR